MPVRNNGTEHDRDSVDLARLDDAQLTGHGDCVGLVHALLERRVSDACDLVRGKLNTRQAGGTLDQLAADVAAWMGEVVHDLPPDAADRIRQAVLVVVEEGATNGST